MTAREDFYIEDHALIFGLLGRAAEDLCGEAGLTALGQAVTDYARERGARMAARCRRDGRPLTMQSWLLYSELADTRRLSRSLTTQIVPKYLNTVEYCEWCAVWQKHGLLRYGAVYCSYADRNIVYGFNPQLDMKLDGILTHGAETCAFEWCGADFSSEQEFYDLMALKYAEGGRNIRDLLYHTGHILSAVSRSFARTLPDAASEIANRALDDYEALMGHEKRLRLEAEASLDFTEI